MKKDTEIFIREKFTQPSANYVVGLVLLCEKHPDLTVDQVLDQVKQKGSTEEHYDNLDIAFEFIKENRKKLGLK